MCYEDLLEGKIPLITTKMQKMQALEWEHKSTLKINLISNIPRNELFNKKPKPKQEVKD